MRRTATTYDDLQRKVARYVRSLHVSTFRALELRAASACAKLRRMAEDDKGKEEEAAAQRSRRVAPRVDRRFSVNVDLELERLLLARAKAEGRQSVSDTIRAILESVLRPRRSGPRRGLQQSLRSRPRRAAARAHGFRWSSNRLGPLLTFGVVSCVC